MRADSSMAGFTLQFADWFLEVIALDGVEVQQQRSSQIQSAGILFPGQRMDVILHPQTDVFQHGKAIMKVAIDTKCVHNHFPNETTSVSLTMSLREHL